MIEPTVRRPYSPRVSDEDLLQYADQGHDLRALTYSRRARLVALQAARDGRPALHTAGEIARETVACDYCGKEFARRPNKRHRYCGDDACFREHENRRTSSYRMGPKPPPGPRKAPTLTPFECSHCGATFLRSKRPPGRHGLFCSAVECRRALQRVRMKAYGAEKRAQGINIFAPYQAKSAAKTRAKIAAGEMQPWRQRYPEKARRLDALRRARKLGALVGEKFENEAIYERDGWICGICRRPVDPALAWPDTQSATLDHVIPISRGGTHSSDNVQLAHYGCNSRKGDKMPAASRKRR